MASMSGFDRNSPVSLYHNTTTKHSDQNAVPLAFSPFLDAAALRVRRTHALFSPLRQNSGFPKGKSTHREMPSRPCINYQQPVPCQSPQQQTMFVFAHLSSISRIVHEQRLASLMINKEIEAPNDAKMKNPFPSDLRKIVVGYLLPLESVIDAVIVFLTHVQKELSRCMTMNRSALGNAATSVLVQDQMWIDIEKQPPKRLLRILFELVTTFDSQVKVALFERMGGPILTRCIRFAILAYPSPPDPTAKKKMTTEPCLENDPLSLDQSLRQESASISEGRKCMERAWNVMKRCLL